MNAAASAQLGNGVTRTDSKPEDAPYIWRLLRCVPFVSFSAFPAIGAADVQHALRPETVRILWAIPAVALLAGALAAWADAPGRSRALRVSAEAVVGFSAAAAVLVGYRSGIWGQGFDIKDPVDQSVFLAPVVNLVYFVRRLLLSGNRPPVS